MKFAPWLVVASLVVLGGVAASCAKSVTDPDVTPPDVDGSVVDSSACPDADVTTDPKNCGGCGHKCVTGQVCSSGACKAECDPPTAKCTGVTTCVDLTKDPKHCGACTKVCDPGDASALPPGDNNPLPDSGIGPDAGDAGPAWTLGTPDCVTSACTVQCQSPMLACSGFCFDVTRSHEHCGDCKTACAADQACGGGHCCPVGQSYCNGACVDILGDPKNCGSCGNVCPNGLSCGNGVCSALLGSGTDVDPWHFTNAPLACIDFYNKLGNGAKDGIYTTSPLGTPINVYCDMSSGGITYESFGMGQYTASYAGWTFVGGPDFSGSKQFDAAFSYLYNRDYLVNIKPGWSSGNCCFINTTKTDYIGIGTNSYMYPGLANSSSFTCGGPYSDPKYRFWWALSSTIKASYTPAEAGQVTISTSCGVSGNPAVFVKRYK